jgi:hypothetical protein
LSASPLEYLRHILDETIFISSAIQGVTEQAFMSDEALKRAFVRSIEIIGEASKKGAPAGLISRHAPVSSASPILTYSSMLRSAPPRLRRLSSKFPPAGEESVK